jgi:hypothetical protein
VLFYNIRGEGMRSRGKWKGPEDGSRIGKRKVRELCGPDGARRSTAVSSEYDETQVSARKTGVTSLNIQETGANLGAGPARLRDGTHDHLGGIIPTWTCRWS